MFSQVTMMGRLVRDPEVRYTPAGSAVCDITIVVTETYKKDGEKQEKTAFVPCVAWGKLAETIGQYLGKGEVTLVSGRIQQQDWVDKDSGGKRSKLVVCIEKLSFVPGANKGSKAQGGPQEDVNEDQVPF